MPKGKTLARWRAINAQLAGSAGRRRVSRIGGASGPILLKNNGRIFQKRCGRRSRSIPSSFLKETRHV